MVVPSGDTRQSFGDADFASLDFSSTGSWGSGSVVFDVLEFRVVL
jgi:hypothetical protein